jgi:hypothetical protein
VTQPHCWLAGESQPQLAADLLPDAQTRETQISDLDPLILRQNRALISRTASRPSAGTNPIT